MLTLMRFDQEIVEPKAVGLTGASLGAPKVRPAELEMAEKLLESMSTKWDPSAYKDEFRTKLRALLERRARSGKTVKEPAHEKPEPSESNVIDLVAVLQRSLAKRGARRAARPRRVAAPARRGRQAR